MQMCQTMVDKVARSKQLSAVTDPELLILFDNWLEELEAQVLEYLKSRGPVSEKTFAKDLGLSLKSASFILSKLNREGKLRKIKEG